MYTREVRSAGGVVVKQGSLVSHRCGGGGGFGPASERDPELARLDLERGYRYYYYYREGKRYRKDRSPTPSSP